MSYDIYVDGECKGQIASNNGWHETAEYLLRHGGQECALLAHTGESHQAHTLSDELHKIGGEASTDIASVIKSIAMHNAKHGHIGITQEEL